MIPGKQVISGELHYPRIPRAYWSERMRMARAMGLNAVSTYVFWNRHEPRPGVYDFSGENDVAAFVRCARDEDLAVILRPGPYVCAEWDFGGLPWWLLALNVRVRTAEESYMTPVRAWLRRLGAELAPLQRSRGGPIEAVQLENEYGAFGGDRAYLRALHRALVDAGFGESPFFTIDQPKDLQAGSLDELPIAATFAPGNPQAEFEHVRKLRAQAPLLAGEYWAGWFDHWGEPHHRLDDEQQARDLGWMLREGCSVNIYMFHGGTNFGFWNGANSSPQHPYEPATTSYDYDAALDEAGHPTQKYERFRAVIAEVTAVRPPPVPAMPEMIIIEEFELTHACALFHADLGAGISSERPRGMESFGQGYGYILYRASIEGPLDTQIEIDAVRDYALIAIDGEVVSYLDRRFAQNRAPVTCSSGPHRLDILVENGGRINYGPDMPFERKGITGAVRIGGCEITGWTVFLLPFTDVSGFTFVQAAAAPPALYRGTFTIDEPGDAFLDVSDLGKGALWLNGRNLGRFWNVGPQRHLYAPGVWLVRGTNEVVALELLPRMERGTPALRGIPRAAWQLQ